MNLTIWQAGLVLLCFLYSPQSAAATPEHITEAMLQEMADSFPPLVRRQVPCADKITSYPIAHQKGLAIELVLKEGLCTENFDFAKLRQSIIDNYKNSQLLQSFISWYQRGFFLEYALKAHDGKALGKIRVDPQTMHWQAFSTLVVAPETADELHIAIGGKTLSFFAKGFVTAAELVPGYPMAQHYCGIDYQQEKYLFIKGKVRLLLSVIALPPTPPAEQQLQCINKADFEVQNQPSEHLQKAAHWLNGTVHPSEFILTPIYTLNETQGQEKNLISAFSALADPHTAIYIVYEAPNDAANQVPLKALLASIKLNPVP